MLRPVPCSPLSEPSKRRTTTSQTSSMSAWYRATSAGTAKSWVKMKWRFPSRAWPKMIPSA